LGCEYVRKPKKRGKASQKDLAQRAAAAANRQKSPTDQALDEQSPIESRNENGSSTTSLANENSEFQQSQASRALSLNSIGLDGKNPTRQQSKGRLRAGSLEGLTEISNNHQPHIASPLQFDPIGSPTSLNLNYYSSISGSRPVLSLHMIESNSHSTFDTAQMNVSGYTNSPYAIQAQDRTKYLGNTQGPLYLGDNPLPGFPIHSDVASPGGWISLRSPSNQYQQHDSLADTDHTQDSCRLEYSGCNNASDFKC
jgi:hypothetical protein